MGDIVKHQEKFNEKDVNARFIQNGKFESVYQALFTWFTTVHVKKVPITEEIIKSKAKF